MSTLAVNTITNAAGGNTAQINGMTPTAQSLQGLRNRIINGDMRIDQRNNGASVTITAASASQYVLDRYYLRSESATGSKVSVQRSTVAPAGFTNSQLITSLSAYTLGASEHFATTQAIEGFNVSDLGWGTAAAQAVTLSFKVRSSLTGTFGGVVSGSSPTRAYVFSYTIAAANTWQDVTITIPGDTSGTWATDNSAGIFVSFGVAAGSSTTGAAGSWSSTFSRSVTGQVSLVGTSGATFYITGVQLEAGSVATPFERIDYGRQLIQCQRYYARLNATYSNFAAFSSGMVVSTTLAEFYVKYPVQMRGAATVTQSNTKINAGLAGPATSSISAVYAGTDSCYLALNASGMTVGYGAVLVANNNASAYIDLSSEL